MCFVSNNNKPNKKRRTNNREAEGISNSGCPLLRKTDVVFDLVILKKSLSFSLLVVEHSKTEVYKILCKTQLEQGGTNKEP